MNPDRPRVSIGLPVYNAQKYLHESVDSILSQTFGDFELIISDNASTDDTEDICRNYAKSDNRIRYYRYDKNQGAPWNFNNVLRHARGRYFRWQCADDMIAPSHLACCVEMLDREPGVVLCYGRTTIIDDKGNALGEYNNGLNLIESKAKDRYKHLYDNLELCNVQYGLMRIDAVKKTSLLGNYIGSDEVFLGELAIYGKFREIPEELFFVRMHSGSSSSISTLSELQKFYDPTRKAGIKLRLWRHLYEKLKTIFRSDIRIIDKVELCGYLFRDAIAARDTMFKELKLAWHAKFCRGPREIVVQENAFNPYLGTKDDRSKDHQAE